MPERRRFFLEGKHYAWAALGGAVSAFFSKTASMIPEGLFRNQALVFRAGKIEDYPEGRVSPRFTESRGVWMVRTLERLYVLGARCPHCEKNLAWNEKQQKFLCPDGAGFYKTGIPFEGPRLESLLRYGISLDEEGGIVVDLNQEFRHQDGGWDHPQSFLSFPGR